MSSIERLTWLAALVLTLAGALILYERHAGAANCVKADVAAVAAQETHNAVRAATQAATINQEAITFHDTTSLPAPLDVPHVQLCHYTPAGTLPAAVTAGREPHAAAASGSADSSGVKVTVDVGPSLVKIGRDSDAQVAALIAYIRNVCLAP